MHSHRLMHSACVLEATRAHVNMPAMSLKFRRWALNLLAIYKWCPPPTCFTCVLLRLASTPPPPPYCPQRGSATSEIAKFSNCLVACKVGRTWWMKRERGECRGETKNIHHLAIHRRDGCRPCEFCARWLVQCVDQSGLACCGAIVG